MEIEHGGSFSRHTHPRAYLVEISMFAAQVSSKIQIGNNLKQKEIKQTCNIEARAEIVLMDCSYISNSLVAIA